MNSNILTLTPTQRTMDVSLGFEARTVEVTNYTSSYVHLPDCPPDIPPWVYGAVRALPAGIRYARASLVSVSPPPVGPPVPATQAILTWGDVASAPDPGRLLPQSAAANIQATRVWQARGLTGSGWQSVGIFSGNDLPYVNNQLFVAQWSLAAIIGAGTATDVLCQIALGPKGHPGGPPELIMGAEITIPDTTHVATQRGVLSPPQPIDLNAFFSGGNFAAQPLEAQVFASIGGSGTITDLTVMLTVLSAL